jgi:hypothetical protein
VRTLVGRPAGRPCRDSAPALQEYPLIAPVGRATAPNSTANRLCLFTSD